MSKIRIYSLARELNLDNNQVLELARSLGADASTPSSAIDDAIGDKIRAQKTDQKATPAPPRQQGQPAQRGQRGQQGQQGQPAQPARQGRQGQQGQQGQQGRRRTQTPKQSAPADAPVAAPDSSPAADGATPAKAVAVPAQRRSSHAPKPIPPAPLTATETPVSPPAASGRHAKRYYLVDGLNVCNWQKTPSLAPLVTLLIELKRQGHSFLCIFDANTRFVLEDLGERDKYEHLLNRFDCIGEVPGGTQADDFLLFRAHKTGDAIISNDQYRDQKYRERYKWLRSVSPRLCKGIVLGGFLILPELDVHARVRESLASIIKEFEEVFGSSTAHRERPDQRHEIKSLPRNEPRPEPRSESKPAETRQKADPKHEEKPAAPANDIAPLPEGSAAPPGAEASDQTAEARPRSRRGRRRRGRRGGGGSAAGNPANSAGGNGGAGSAQ